jgi:carboxymethylenebutenolidase
MGELIEFQSNGGTGQGYLAVPGSGRGPGVVVIQEWWGLVPHIKEVCDRLASEGFVALAPDLYHGQETTEPDDAGKLMMGLRLEQAAKDMSGAVDALLKRSAGDLVGVIGFCMGGGLALILASKRPDAVAVCSAFYGAIPWEGEAPSWADLRAHVQIHVGDKDNWALSFAEDLGPTLWELDKDCQIFRYEGADHAFFNDTRPEVYDGAAASLAWRRTLELLHDHLD